jgi:hypothetical protein
VSDIIACSFRRVRITISNNQVLVRYGDLAPLPRWDLFFLSYFEFETLAFCGVDNPLACSIRIRLTSWIVSGFPCTE